MENSGDSNVAPKVSVLVPVYGVEKWIEHCARSLFEQTLEDVEFIFVNDCTKDRSIEVLRSVAKDYPTRNIHIIEHEKNAGVLAAIQTAMDNAKGDYWIFCDSDDFVESTYCEKLYNAAKSTGADIAACNIREEWGSWACDRKFKYDKMTLWDELHTLDINSAVHQALWNKLINARIYKEHNIEWWYDVKSCDDYFYYLRVVSFANFTTIVPESLYHYNKINGASITHNLSLAAYQSRLRGIHYLEQFYKDNNLQTDASELINYLKVRCRMGLFFVATKEAVQCFKENFKESNSYIWKVPDMSTAEKMLARMVTILPTCVCVPLLKVANRFSKR